MKLNRITAVAAVVVALMIVVGQFVGGAQAAPPTQPAARYQASGVTAQAAPAQVAPASKQGDKQKVSKGKVGSPADQSPLDFTVQGRLTDSSGNPIHVATAVAFNLYDVPSGGTALLTQSASVTPDLNGLFTYVFVVDTTGGNFTNVLYFSEKLYLGITVAGDAEMTPRFELTASPYAMSLAPGAVVTGDFNYSNNVYNGLLNLENTDTASDSSAGLYATGPLGVWGSSGAGAGVYGESSAGSTSFGSIGVDGVSTDPNGYGGSFTGPYFGGYFNANDTSTSAHAGVQATGATGVWGTGDSTGSSNGYGGYFYNYAGGSGFQVGSYAYTAKGYGVYAQSVASTGSQPAWSLFATDGTQPASNGFINTGVTAYRKDANNAAGVLTYAPGAGGKGVLGQAYDSLHTANGDPSAVGVYAAGYDLTSGATGLYVQGSGHASGGFFSPLGFGMVVRYNGSTDLHPGDILALDGNNTTLNGDTLIGVVKADGANAGAAIGVAQYRIATTTTPLDPSAKKGATQQVTYVDNKATVIKPGDLVQIVTSGQASIKVSGSLNIGDHIAVSSDGSLATTKDSANSIGKVASKPDNNGNVTVIVNFK